MRMDDPKPTFKYLVESIKELYPDFAYIHVVDPRAEGNRDRIPDPGEVRVWSLPAVRKSTNSMN